jgi:hypothetical protein
VQADFKEFDSIFLESGDGQTFETVSLLNKGASVVKATKSSATNFRLRTTDNKSVIYYSNQVKVKRAPKDDDNIWPNPTSSNLNVRFNSNFPAKASYRIYNATGKQLAQAPLQFKQGVNTVAINTSGLQKGLYQLVIKTDMGQTANYRFFKQ